MLVHETHSFYVIVKLDNCKNAPDGYLEKKNAIFSKVLTNIGLEKVVDFDGIWQFKDVMYSASDDIFDIISNEMIRIVAQDTSIAASEKKLYELSAANDHIIVSEYLTSNTYTIK